MAILPGVLLTVFKELCEYSYGSKCPSTVHITDGILDYSVKLCNFSFNLYSLVFIRLWCTKFSGYPLFDVIEILHLTLCKCFNSNTV